MILGNLFKRNKIPSSPGIPGATAPTLPSTHASRSVKTALIGVIILALGLVFFGIWAYGRMLDYKNNSDEKSAAAVEEATAEQKTALEAVFAEESKSPLKTYTSPSEYGSVVITYPKTWSAYVAVSANNKTVVDGYFSTDYLSSISNDADTLYNLRLKITKDDYENIVDDYQTSISQGKITAIPFTPSSVEGASTGLRLDGQLTKDKRGAMIILPLRDKVLMIWTESEASVADFNNYIITNLSFSP